MAKKLRKTKTKLNHAAVLTALIGLILFVYSMSFTSSCGNQQYAATKAEHFAGFQCTIPFGDIILLSGIGLLIIIIGLATLKVT